MAAFFAGANKRTFFAPYTLTGKGPRMITFCTSAFYQCGKNIEAEIWLLFFDNIAVTSIQFMESDTVQRFGGRNYLGNSVDESRENFSHALGV